MPRKVIRRPSLHPPKGKSSSRRKATLRKSPLSKSIDAFTATAPPPEKTTSERPDWAEVDCCEEKLTICGFDPYYLSDGYYYNPVEAMRWLDFIEEFCTHVIGAKAGEAFICEVWQRVIVKNLFGWLRNDGSMLRRFRRMLLYIPKKNGKTIFAVALAFALWFIDGEEASEIYAAAGKKDQAAIFFRVMYGMANNEERLGKHLKFYQNTKSINRYDDPLAVFSTLSSDAKTEQGSNVHGALIDELHAHDSPKLAQGLISGTVGRPNPLTIMMTTADYQDRDSLCNQTLLYAKKVRDREAEDASYFPIIFEATKEDDWKDPKVHFRVNPNLGRGLPLETFNDLFKLAQNDSSYINEFKRLHLNLQTSQNSAFIAMEDWINCSTPYKEKDLQGLGCCGGLDASSVMDYTCLAYFFPSINAVKLYAWLPEGAVKESANDYYMLKEWIEKGILTMIPGERIKQGPIIEKIVECSELYDVKEIAYDKWNCQFLATDLSEDYDYDMVTFQQNFSCYNEPLKNFAGLVKSGVIRHNRNPLLKRMVGNAVKKENDNNQIMLNKRKSTGSIDGLVAAVMAYARTCEHDEGDGIGCGFA